MPEAGDGILITGASGFIGRVVSDAVKATFPACPVTSLGGPSHARGGIDLTLAEEVRAVIKNVRPRVVIHLAAQASVNHANNAAADAWRANVLGSLNLGEALAEMVPNALLIHAGSAEVYGDSFASGEVLDEAAPLRPNNPYARTKVAAEMALTDTLAAEGRLVLLRLFNHTGPGQDERFVAPSFAAQIARIEASGAPGITQVGDLSAERDFGDVTDAAEAFVSVMKAADALPRISTFNVCSGTSRPIRSILDSLVSQSTQPIDVQIDPTRLRGASIPRAAGSHAALSAATGWKPVANFQDTMHALLAYWRLQVV